MSAIMASRIVIGASFTLWVGCIVVPMAASWLGDKDGVVFWAAIPIASLAIFGMVTGAMLYVGALFVSVIWRGRHFNG